MKRRHFFGLGMWAIATTTGGVVVADHQVVSAPLTHPQKIPTGTPLRLGVLLPETPTSRDRNQIMLHALYRLQEQVNRCGGINQAPVFWVIENPTLFSPLQTSHKPILEFTSIHSRDMALALEVAAMQTLIRQKNIHGAIAVFTPRANSKVLHSDALNLAIESQLPVISPLNTETTVAHESRSELFKRDPKKVSSPQKLTYWARTIPSDRQHLSAIAQLTRQKNWQRIATIAPDTPRGHHLEQLFTDALTTLGGTIAQSNAPIRYPLPSNHHPTASASSPPPVSQASPISTTISLAPLSNQPPDAILLILSSSHPLKSLQQLTAQLSEIAELNQIPVILDRWVDVDDLLRQHHTLPAPTPESETQAFPSTPQSQPQSTDQSQSTTPSQITDQSTIATQPQKTDRQNAYPSQLPNNRVHWFNGLWGLAPEPQTPGWQGFYKTTPHSETPISPAPYMWDAAALMVLAAEAAGSNSKDGIQAELRNVANPPGVEVTDICQGLERIRQGESINYQGISGQVDLGGWGNVNRVQHYGIWQINQEGDRQTLEPLQWSLQ